MAGARVTFGLVAALETGPATATISAAEIKTIKNFLNMIAFRVEI
jgi:hypothetical protein